MIFLGDMSQQIDNEGFMRYNVKMGYKTCFCPKKERENLKYDIKINNKYHKETLRHKEYVEDLENVIKFRTFFWDKGIRLKSSSVAKLALILNLI